MVAKTAYALFHKFLDCQRRGRRDKDGRVPPYTHVRMPNKWIHTPGGSYNIVPSKENIIRFYTLYAKAVYETKGKHMHILESNDRTTPLKIDLDFRQSATQETQDRLATLKHAREFVVHVMRAADLFLNPESMLSRRDTTHLTERPSVPSCPRTALVFRRPQMVVDNQKNIRKDGLHVIFPELILDTFAQHVIRGKVVMDLETIRSAHDDASSPESMGALLTALTNSPSDVYDKAVVERNPWMMYGSDKPGKHENAYQLVLALRVGRRPGEYTLTDEPIDEYTRRIVHRLPQTIRDALSPGECTIFAMAYHLRMRCYDGDERPVAYLRMNVTEESIFTRIVSKCIPSPTTPQFKARSASNVISDDRTLDYVMGLVNILSTVRATREDDWFRIGFALCNISPATETRLLDAWIDWSKRPSQYRNTATAACRSKWCYFRRATTTSGNRPQLGLHSIEESARRDNKPEFARLQREFLHHRLVSALMTRDYDIAEIITRLDNAYLRYKCTDVSAKIWYIYDEKTGLWRRDKGRHPLSLDIPQKLYPLMKDVIETEYRRSCALAHEEHRTNSSPDKTDAEVEAAATKHSADLISANNIREKKLKKLNPLMSSGKVSAVGSFISSLLYDTEFANRLDQNLDLIGMGDGYVFDLHLGVSRRARPSDMLTLSTGQSFYPPGSDAPDATHSKQGTDNTTHDFIYHVQHPDVLNYLTFMRDVFPDPATENYIQKWLASMFEGHTRDELFHVLVGTGANGKSKLQTLVQHIFGTYFATTPIKTFTGDRVNASSATSHYQHIKNKRCVFVQEPNEHERFNVGVLKELTGGDSLYSRQLYQEASEFKPQAKFAITANNKPKLPPDDEAVWRRMRCIRFVMKFVMKPDPKNPYQKLRDNTMDKKIEKFASAAHWYLLTQMYPQYKRDGIIHESQVPPAILFETQQYRAANDEIQDFIQEQLIHRDHNNDDDDDDVEEYGEVSTTELCIRFSKWVLSRRPRSVHIRIAKQNKKIIELFTKRRKWKTPVQLDQSGMKGWPDWVWSSERCDFLS